METSDKPIAALDKVRLNLKIVPAPDQKGLKPVESDVTFIYGIGSAGIPVFEKMLFEKVAGDRIDLSVESGAERTLFGHLIGPLLRPLRAAPPYTLHVTVLSVAAASDQEVVKAMAQVAGCGGGCECGCSC
jgi:hypothetical protein